VKTELTERNAKHQADAEEELKVLWPSKATKAPKQESTEEKPWLKKKAKKDEE
jgi:hypothetical protein